MTTPTNRTGWSYGALTVIADTGRRYRGEVVWECRTADDRTIFRRSSLLTKLGKRLGQERPNAA